MPVDLEMSPFPATVNGQRQEIYARLAEAGTVHRITMPSGMPAWLVTGYDEVRMSLADPRLVKQGPLIPAAAALPPEIDRAMNSDLLHLDPPDHTRLRRLVSAAFTRRRVDDLAPRMTQVADQLLDAMGDAGRPGPVDLLDAYAFPLPMTVICELLGVPAEDAACFRGLSTTIVTGSLADQREWMTAATSLVAYIRSLVEIKRRNPADDLLSALIASRDGDDRLSQDELTSMVLLLLIAGHETTVNLIANSVFVLLQHPEQLAAVREDRGRLPAVVEEVLRLESPVQVATPRFTTEPVDLGGVRIPAGQMVFASVLAGGRDRVRFERSDSFDPGRSDLRHVAFGHGIHHCLGAPLARAEAVIALDRLLSRFPDLRMAVPVDELTWRPSVLMHGLFALPVLL